MSSKFSVALPCASYTDKKLSSIPDTSNMPKHFRGMAVRVEDEVAVGMDDYTVLSANCPSQIADVEATCLNQLENPLLQLPFRA